MIDPNTITDPASYILLLAVFLSTVWREQLVRLYTLLFMIAGFGLLLAGLLYNNLGIVRMEVVFIAINLYGFLYTFDWFKNRADYYIETSRLFISSYLGKN